MPMTRTPTVGAQTTTVVAGMERARQARHSFYPKASLSCFMSAPSSKWSSTATAPPTTTRPTNTRAPKGTSREIPILTLMLTTLHRSYVRRVAGGGCPLQSVKPAPMYDGFARVEVCCVLQYVHIHSVRPSCRAGSLQ